MEHENPRDDAQTRMTRMAEIINTLHLYEDSKIEMGLLSPSDTVPTRITFKPDSLKL